uniref:Uncharacterized protein n=1 Tax=Arundo donax TaxID=35708 RepID=A0A0A9FMF5_ARUDO
MRGVLVFLNLHMGFRRAVWMLNAMVPCILFSGLFENSLWSA